MPLDSIEVDLENIFNDKSFGIYSSFVGSILVILAQICILKDSKSFAHLIYQILNFIQASCNHQTENVDKWIQSFKTCTSKFVDV